MEPRQVTLLYRYLGKPRTFTRFMVKAVPPLLMFTHWAIEIGDEKGKGHMFELQYYYDDSKVRYRLPVDQDVERQHYKVAPFINKQIGEVRTIMTPKQILQIARGIIDRNPRYTLVSGDCHVFALTLLHSIVIEPSFRLRAIYQLQEFLRVIVYPLSRTATEIVKALGGMTDPVEHKIKTAMGKWLAHRSTSHSHEFNSLEQDDFSRPTMVQAVHKQSHSEELIDYFRIDHDCDEDLTFVRGGYVNVQWPGVPDIQGAVGTMRLRNLSLIRPLTKTQPFPCLFQFRELNGYGEEGTSYSKGRKGVTSQSSEREVSDSDATEESDDHEDDAEDSDEDEASDD